MKTLMSMGPRRLTKVALCLSLSVGALSLLISRAEAFFGNYAVNWKSAVSADPGQIRVGYLTDFAGLGLTAPLAKDLTVHIPAGLTHTYVPLTVTNQTAHVVGIIESASWAGGVGDALSFSVYMSAANAHQLAALNKLGLKNVSLSSVGFWVGNYDIHSKAWYEEFYPKAPAKLVGQLHAASKNDVRLHVADEGTKFSPKVDTLLYNVFFEVVPAANQTATFVESSSSSVHVVKSWGLVVGAHPGDKK